MIQSRFFILHPLTLACAVLLGGCAAQNAYRDGRTLAMSGQKDAALAKFEEASRADPNAVAYRLAVVQIREGMVYEQLAIAQRALAAEDDARARQAFERVLALQPNQPRAIEGLRYLEGRSRQLKWISLAESEMGKSEYKQAQFWIKKVMAEDPYNNRAAVLQALIDQAVDKAPANNALSDAYRKPISIEFKDAPIKTIFEVISRSSGLNFLFDKDVRADQKTSIFLKNSTIEAAVNLTLLTNQLEQRTLDANTVLIYPNTQAKQRDYQSLTIKTFYLVNGEAKNVANTLKTILKTRDVVVDEKLNMIIVRDSPQAIALAEKLVAVHDVSEPEVMLEVEVLEVKRTRLMDLGIRWPDQLSLSPLGTGLTVADLRNLNSNTIGVSIPNIILNAKKVDTDANILANPRIRARNREKAKIMIGERVPNITTTSTSTGFVSESVNYVDVGLKLDVEPTIYPDGDVAIKIALEVSNIINQVQTRSGSIAYHIGTRTAQTVLRLRDGENQVLAGLINDEDRRTGNKIPGLGEVPVVGRLFGSGLDDNSKTEIVLSITPRILRNIERPSTNTLEFDSGTEANFGARVIGAGIVGVAPSATGNEAQVGQSVFSRPDSNTTRPPGNPNLSCLASPAPNTDQIAKLETPQASAAGASAQLRWQGPAALRVGETFAVQLMMQADQPVVSIPMAVGFDPRVLQVVSITEGDFLKQNGAQTSFTSRVDPNGQILMTGTRAGDSGATGLGSVATINLRVSSAATPEARLQLLTVAPIALGGRGISAPLPLPHTITITP